VTGTTSGLAHKSPICAFLKVQLPYLQPFIDVNKRTSRLAAKFPLIKFNLVPLSFIGVPERAYTESVMVVYEFNRVELIRDVFVWAYERSCQRYVTVLDSLPEPDPFRLKYRTTLREVIGSIIKDGKKPKLGVCFSAINHAMVFWRRAAGCDAGDGGAPRDGGASPMFAGDGPLRLCYASPRQGPRGSRRGLPPGHSLNSARLARAGAGLL